MATLPAFMPLASISSFLVCSTEASCSQNKDEVTLSRLFPYASGIPLKLFRLIWQLLQEFQDCKVSRKIASCLGSGSGVTGCCHVKFYQASQNKAIVVQLSLLVVFKSF